MTWIVESAYGLLLVNLCSLIPLFYMLFACLILFFEMKLNGFFVVEKGFTDSASFLFISQVMSRVGFPLCYNFAQLLNMEKSLAIAVLVNGNHNNVSISIQRLLPVVLLFFVLLKLFRFYEKILDKLGLPAIRYEGKSFDSKVAEGKKIILNGLGVTRFGSEDQSLQRRDNKRIFIQKLKKTVG